MCGWGGWAECSGAASHPPGETCPESGINEVLIEWTTATEFKVTLSSAGTACVDVPAIPQSDDPWTIDLVIGSARDVAVAVKDAQPGDFCWGTEITKESTIYTDVYLTSGEDLGGCFGDEYTDSDETQLVFAAMAGGRNSFTEELVITVRLP